MTKYFLNEDVLMTICYFHQTLEGSVKTTYRQEIKEQIIKNLNNQLFKDLLIKQPELNNIYEAYTSKINNSKGDVYPSSLFAEMFADKIEIDNFKIQLLTKNYTFKDKIKRQNIFKYLLEEHPPFLKLVHDFIKDNKDAGNTFLSEDSLLWNFYFTTLKNKGSIYDILKSEEILDNIDFFNSPFEVALNKKKLNAYLMHFPKDMNLYEHIMQNMGKLLNSDALFKQLWEDKINLFPKDVQDDYYKQNITIKPWMEQSSYHYKFQVNEEYIIEQAKVSSIKAEKFSRVFHNSLGSIIRNQFNPINETKTDIPSVSFLFSIEKDRSRAKIFCNSVAENILFLIKNTNFDLQYNEQYELIDRELQKIYMTFALGEELNIENPIKNNKIKNKL